MYLEQNPIETVGKYHYAIQGVSRKDGKLKPVLFSPERWILEEKGGAWKIVQIQERS